jgi:PhoPQ-activated pathogenicity-related protein
MAIAAAIVPLDEYVSSPEPAYKWEKLNDATFKSALGNTVHVLNVTSLDWLDSSRAQGVSGTTWTHLVYVVIPKEIKYYNVSNAYITGGDNRHPNKVAGPTDEDVLLTDALAKYSGQVSIAIQ